MDIIQRTMAGKLKGLWSELTAIHLLNGHIIKLTSICIFPPQMSEALKAQHRSFVCAVEAYNWPKYRECQQQMEHVSHTPPL